MNKLPYTRTVTNYYSITKNVYSIKKGNTIIIDVEYKDYTDLVYLGCSGTIRAEWVSSKNLDIKITGVIEGYGEIEISTDESGKDNVVRALVIVY